jgi:hypothetical protein
MGFQASMDGPTAAKEKESPSKAGKLRRGLSCQMGNEAERRSAIMQSFANSIFIAMPQTDPGS